MELQKNEFEFFYFSPAEWDRGKIRILSDAKQGFYIKLCTLAWTTCGILCNNLETLSYDLRKDKRTCKALIDEFLQLGVIKEDGDTLVIKFLRDQYLRTKEEYEKKAQQRKDAINSRWEKYRSDNARNTTVQQHNNETSTGETREKYENHTEMNRNEMNRKKDTDVSKEKNFFALFPESLKTKEIEEAWENWIKDRKQRRKPVTELAAKKQIGKLLNLTPQEAVNTINAAIEKGWVTFYPADNNGNSGDLLTSGAETSANQKTNLAPSGLTWKEEERLKREYEARKAEGELKNE